MLPENIDDLFRDKLDGHETPPGHDLWARLQAGPTAPDAQPEPEANRLDQLFQNRLHAHATPPGRELWERLEDEHLHPRKRRAAAWWPMTLAAAVVLFLLVGGAGLWLGFPTGNIQQTTVASNPAQHPNADADRKARSGSPQSATPDGTTGPDNNSIAADKQQPAVASASDKAAPDAAAPRMPGTSAAVAEKKHFLQATRPDALASTAPKARMTAAEQSPRHLLGSHRQPDAAAASLPLVAHAPARPTAADEQHLTPAPTAPTVATATPQPAPDIIRAIQNPALAHATELITVDVRNGAAPTSRPARFVSSALAAVEGPEEQRRLGGRLLQQAGRLVRGERVSLAEVTGLPENVTLRATFAGHSVSKSIQL
ncbi:hypothetical protein [Hymenobacter siberiensis]|jgi:hypothetical protein|uniref:hypothetical protein n=1 Tax=Hymenobacter siberiensis TaxID=2848396 RepID=UPI001C1E1423|nr:hypothetical protein [Hymenobacter siberiensis]MBU6121829.1 hypothetical protein [Hymenobacter siberiensis]